MFKYNFFCHLFKECNRNSFFKKIGKKIAIALMIMLKSYKDQSSDVSVVFTYPQVPAVEKHRIRGPDHVRFVAKLIK
jgi:hypothetical protein